MLTRIRLDIAYDGTEFSGWSSQLGLRTVQGELEAALGIVLRRHQPIPSLVVAGRTDAGVHAIGQVAHIDFTAAQLLSLDRPGRGGVNGSYDGPASLARRLNGIAGFDGDIYLSRSALAEPGFDARFSPIWRRYEYRVSDMLGPRNPLDRHRTVWYHATLDLDTMNLAAAELLGLHDWAAYCKPREGATTVRTLQDFRWRREPDGVLVATVQGDAFCHSMVRSLVGACVAAGRGTLALQQAAAIRDSQIRGNSDFKVMPAKGLTLMEVGYPPADELGARAALTRARRQPIEASG